jgi:hypothetical protein
VLRDRRGFNRCGVGVWFLAGGARGIGEAVFAEAVDDEVVRQRPLVRLDLERLARGMIAQGLRQFGHGQVRVCPHVADGFGIGPVGGAVHDRDSA